MTPEEPDVASIEFDPEPRTSTEYIKDIWHRVGRLEERVAQQNGRVGRLERAMFAAIGGLAVISAVVVPIFLSQIAH